MACPTDLAARSRNLFERDDAEIDCFYASRLWEPPGPDDGGYDDVHFHPVYPLTLRAMLTARF